MEECSTLNFQKYVLIILNSMMHDDVYIDSLLFKHCRCILLCVLFVAYSYAK